MNLFTKGLNVSCRTIRGKSYILLEDKAEFYCLNETGSFIWEQVDGTQTSQQIVAQVVEQYDGDPNEITTFVLEFLSELTEIGMLMVSNKSAEEVTRNA